ncbi:hypothetical protein T265_06441 [Opisthorchis viverrini]|uniref:Uncharacterized protein n=1 Tax=Opisthorchis viverrini TaxID=6198 RepID=A0A075ADS7_OPIVI|nr:hypothetical protein T265_06441 [Opisthorchis viverrini]KER26244.1 hypothetical protein T265_06441 [Opisthorchis viverrini]
MNDAEREGRGDLKTSEIQRIQFLEAEANTNLVVTFQWDVQWYSCSQPRSTVRFGPAGDDWTFPYWLARTVKRFQAAIEAISNTYQYVPMPPVFDSRLRWQSLEYDETRA